jgi:hypothetical protein
MTTAAGGRNFVAWRDLTAAGQRANSTAQPLPANSFARAVGNVNAQRRAVGRSVAMPPGLSQYGIDSPFSMAAQQVAPEGGFEEALAQARAIRGLPEIAPEPEEGGGGNALTRWAGNLADDAVQTVRALPAGITELAGGLGADIGQYYQDQARQVGEGFSDLREGNFAGAAGNIGVGIAGELPVGNVIIPLVRHHQNPDDYSTSASVAQSFRRTANDAGALGTLATNTGEGRGAAGERLSNRFYNNPFSSFVEDVGNVAAVAAPIGTAVARPAAAVARGGIAADISRGIAAGTARGGLAGRAASVARGTGRVVEATNRGMAVPFTAPFRAARSGLMSIPRVAEFASSRAGANAFGRTLNRAVQQGSMPTTAAYRFAIEEATRVASELGYSRAAVDGAIQLIRSGRMAALGDNATIASVLKADPNFFARDMPAANLTTEGAMFNMPPEAAQLALEYHRNPAVQGALEPALNELNNYSSAMDARQLRGRSEGFKEAMPIEELGGVRYDVDRINADPQVRAASTRQSGLVSQMNAARVDVKTLQRQASTAARRVQVGKPGFAQAVQATGAARQAVAAAKARLAYLGTEVTTARADLVAEINRAMQDYARVPDRLKPAVATVERFRTEAQQFIDDSLAAGVPRSALILHEAALAQLPKTIQEIMANLDYQGYRTSEIGVPAVAPGRRISRITGGQYNPERPLSRVVQDDNISARRPVRRERAGSQEAIPAALELEALYEIENITRATFNVMLDQVFPGFSRTPEQLFGKAQAAAGAADSSGQTLASMGRQGSAQGATLNIAGIDYNVPPGSRWVVWDREALFNGSVQNTLDNGAQIPASEAVFVPESMQHAIQGQIDSMLNSSKHAATRLFDMTNNVYRNSWLFLSPRWQVGNFVGNIFAQWSAGGQSLVQIMSNTRRAAAIVREFNRTGILPDPAMLDFIGQGMTNATSDMLGGIVQKQKPGRVGRVIERSARMNSNFDAVSRISEMMGLMGDDFARIGDPNWRAQQVHNPATGEMATMGELFDNSMRETMRVVGDFTTYTPLERRFWRRIMPFYGWYRHVTKLVLTQPVVNPMRTAWMLHLGDLMFDPEDREMFPSWMQYSTVVDSGGTPWSIGGLVPYGGDSMAGESGIFSNPVEFARRSQAPALNLFGAAAFGTQGIGGDPITDQVGLPTGPLAAQPQRMAGYAGQLLGGPGRAIQGIVQPQSRTTYGTEREFRGEVQPPFRTPLGSLFQYGLGPAPYNPEVDFESIRDQEIRSREREEEERRRREHGG